MPSHGPSISAAAAKVQGMCTMTSEPGLYVGGKITPRPRTLHHAPSWFWVAEALGIEEEVQKVNPFSQSMEI